MGADAAIDPETSIPSAAAFSANLCMRSTLMPKPIVPEVVPLIIRKQSTCSNFFIFGP